MWLELFKLWRSGTLATFYISDQKVVLSAATVVRMTLKTVTVRYQTFRDGGQGTSLEIIPVRHIGSIEVQVASSEAFMRALAETGL